MKTVTLNESAIRYATQALLGPERAQILGEVYDLIAKAQEEAFSEGYESGIQHLSGAHEQGDREGFERGFNAGYDLGNDIATGKVDLPPVIALPGPSAYLQGPHEDCGDPGCCDANPVSDVQALTAEDMRFSDDVSIRGA